MGPSDRHSILRFIAFCQNNILCAAIFCESELGADVAPEQFHVGEGRQETQNKDGSFRLWPGKKSRGPVPCPLRWHLLPLLFPVALPLRVSRSKGDTEQRPAGEPPHLEPRCSLGRTRLSGGASVGGGTWGGQVPATWLGPVSPSSVPTQGPRVFPKAWCPPAAASQGGREVPAAQSEGPGQAPGRAHALAGPQCLQLCLMGSSLPRQRCDGCLL